MKVRAVSKFVRSSPQKVGLVVDVVRGKPVQEALDILQFLPKHAARDVRSCLASAIANAENNYQLDPADLFVSEIFANKGPTIKRYMARAKGRGDRILKRMSHITVVVEDREGA